MHLEASLVRVCGQECPPRVRAPPARISAAPALGARAFGAHISSACPGCAPPARISAAPAPGARAFGAHISSACPGCARLRRAYQQRLPRVRAPPARMEAAPAPGARASGAHGSSACPGCARLRRAWKQRGLALQNSIASAKRLRSLFVPFLPSPRRHNILIQLFL
jgi:hypothetical protein